MKAHVTHAKSFIYNEKNRFLNSIYIQGRNFNIVLLSFYADVSACRVIWCLRIVGQVSACGVKCCLRMVGPVSACGVTWCFSMVGPMSAFGVIWCLKMVGPVFACSVIVVSGWLD